MRIQGERIKAVFLHAIFVAIQRRKQKTQFLQTNLSIMCIWNYHPIVFTVSASFCLKKCFFVFQWPIIINMNRRCKYNHFCRFCSFGNPFCNGIRQCLLRLNPSGSEMDQPCHFAQSKNSILRNFVSNVTRAMEW